MAALSSPVEPAGRPRALSRWKGQPRWSRPLQRALFALGSIAAWQAAVTVGALPKSSIPSATATAEALTRLVQTGHFWDASWLTLSGWAAGLALCVLLGVPLGLLIGTVPFLVRSTRLLVDFLRTIPAVALVPVLLLVMGSTMTMKLVLVVFGSVWPLLTSTVDGVRHVDPVAADTVRSLRLSRGDLYRRLVLPSALPFVITGLRTAAVVALMLTTAAEYLGSVPGLGKSMGEAQAAGAVDVMFAWLVVAGLMGVALNAGFLALERRLIPWVPANREEPR